MRCASPRTAAETESIIACTHWQYKLYIVTLAGNVVATFSPDPEYCRILEHYCPGCATQLETEYVPPGHPPVVDMEWDIDAIRAQWLERGVDPETVITYGPGEDVQQQTAGGPLRARITETEVR